MMARLRSASGRDRKAAETKSAGSYQSLGKLSSITQSLASKVSSDFAFVMPEMLVRRS
jgi:hypothetical protein